MCKNYLELIKKMSTEKRAANGKEIYSINDWKNKSIILNELAELPVVREQAKILYESVPVIYRDSDRFDVTESVVKAFTTAKNNLLVSMETIIKLYEFVNPQRDNENQAGADIKLPEFDNLKEFSTCLDDLNFVITQCPYLLKENEEFRFKAVDVGSLWITLTVVGSAATILIALGKIVDQAVKIKSHMLTVKMQEEQLRSMQIKNDIAEEVKKVYQETNKVFMANSIAALENELGTLTDGEEKGKVEVCLKKLGYWMEKGMQIYSSIETTKEIRDIFPEQQKISFLSDDLQRLIEEKKNK